MSAVRPPEAAYAWPPGRREHQGATTNDAAAVASCRLSGQQGPRRAIASPVQVIDVHDPMIKRRAATAPGGNEDGRCPRWTLARPPLRPSWSRRCIDIPRYAQGNRAPSPASYGTSGAVLPGVTLRCRAPPSGCASRSRRFRPVRSSIAARHLPSAAAGFATARREEVATASFMIINADLKVMSRNDHGERRARSFTFRTSPRSPPARGDDAPTDRNSSAPPHAVGARHRMRQTVGGRFETRTWWCTAAAPATA